MIADLSFVVGRSISAQLRQRQSGWAAPPASNLTSSADPTSPSIIGHSAKVFHYRRSSKNLNPLKTRRLSFWGPRSFLWAWSNDGRNFLKRVSLALGKEIAMRKTAILLAVAFLGSNSFAALAVESLGQEKKDYDDKSAKDNAPGQIKREDESARDIAPGRTKGADANMKADESAKMGKDAGIKSSDKAKISKSDTDKIDHPERQNPTTND